MILIARHENNEISTWETDRPPEEFEIAIKEVLEAIEVEYKGSHGVARVVLARIK